MGNGSFSSDSGPFAVKAVPTDYKGSNWLRGTGFWYPLELQRPRGIATVTDKIRLECTWKQRDNWTEAGTVGIFLPVEDEKSVGEDFLPNGYSLPLFDCKETGRLELTEWEFGEKADIIINKFNWHNNKNLNFLIRCNPCFRNADDIAALVVKLYAEKDGLWDQITEEEINFSTGGLAQLQRADFEHLEKMDALRIEGTGNSIHPKQLVSIIGLDEQLQNFDKNQCRIAYIGADTTENLRSICRFIKQNEEIESKISSFTVYYTKSWDEILLKSLSNKYPIEDIIINDSKLILEPLPEPPEIPKGNIKADIVIATYVTPWVLEMVEDEPKNKIQYKKLLTEIMHDDSVIISTDPISSDHSVRSVLEGRIDNKDFYQMMMDLLPHDTEYYERKSCKRTYWKKGVK